MKNDILLDRLIADLQPVRLRSPLREAGVLAAIGLGELALVLLAGLVRPDFTLAIHTPVLWWKLAGLLFLAVLGIAGAVVSLAPELSPRRWLGIAGGTLVAILMIGGLLDGSLGIQGSMTDRLDWHHGIQCVAKMVALALPMAAALGVIARRGGSTDPSGTALAGAVGAATWGAFVFAFACPSDDPLYIVTWYIVGCGAMIGTTRAIIVRMIRW